VPRTDSRPERDSLQGSGAVGLEVEDATCLLLASNAFSNSEIRAPTLPEAGRFPLAL
jgi:hypothetical protein